MAVLDLRGRIGIIEKLIDEQYFCLDHHWRAILGYIKVVPDPVKKAKLMTAFYDKDIMEIKNLMGGL